MLTGGNRGIDPNRRHRSEKIDCPIFVFKYRYCRPTLIILITTMKIVMMMMMMMIMMMMIVTMMMVMMMMVMMMMVMMMIVMMMIVMMMTYKPHLEALRAKISARNNVWRRLAGTSLGASTSTLSHRSTSPGFQRC